MSRPDPLKGHGLHLTRFYEDVYAHSLMPGQHIKHKW